MKFGQALLSTELSGSMGGTIASSSRGGLGYFRVRRVPGNPRSPGQTIVRTILSAIAAAWAGTLTGPQRAAWEAIAGPTSSGIDAFIKSNSPPMLGGTARYDVAPATLANACGPVTVTPVVDASAHTVSITIPAARDEAATQSNGAVFVSSPQNASPRCPPIQPPLRGHNPRRHRRGPGRQHPDHAPRVQRRRRRRRLRPHRRLWTARVRQRRHRRRATGVPRHRPSLRASEPRSDPKLWAGVFVPEVPPARLAGW